MVKVTIYYILQCILHVMQYILHVVYHKKLQEVLDMQIYTCRSILVDLYMKGVKPKGREGAQFCSEQICSSWRTICGALKFGKELCSSYSFPGVDASVGEPLVTEGIICQQPVLGAGIIAPIPSQLLWGHVLGSCSWICFSFWFVS